MSARIRLVPIIAAVALPILAACSGGASAPTAPGLSPLAAGGTSTGGTSTGGTSTGGPNTGGGGGSTIPTIVARIDSVSSVNNGSSYYPSWQTVWYLGGHSLYAIVPTSQKSNATRVHSLTGALQAGDCVTATYITSGTREYAQDIKLEAQTVCN